MVKAVKPICFATNVVGIWLAYQFITRTADAQYDLYNYLAEEMIDKTYDRFMMPHEEGNRRTIVDSDGN